MQINSAPQAQAAVIEKDRNPDRSGQTVIELRSNLSMSLDGLAAVFLGLSVVTLLVAIGPTLLGYWPVMLAALVHLVAVGWCLRLAWRRNWARERLRIDATELVMEHYELNRCWRARWPVAWVQVWQERPAWGNPRVMLGCHGENRRIGSFLPAAEQDELARVVSESLRPHTAWSDDKQRQVSRG